MKENKEFLPQINYIKQTPKLLIERVKYNLLYEKAFLSLEEKSMSEYAQNTTTWD